MRRLRNITILIASLTSVLLFVRHGAALLAWAQSQATTPNGLTSLRIVSPKNGEKIQQSFVTVQYVPLQPASAAAIPTFELRLDAQDPVHTSDTSYTFTGLTPGLHDLIVQVVDANNTPLAGTRSEARFTIVPQATNSTQPPAGSQNVPTQQPGNQSSATPKDVAILPDARSSLPLLSVIGFGILLGGIISALRTRPAANR
jgi:hypothetical protein